MALKMVLPDSVVFLVGTAGHIVSCLLHMADHISPGKSQRKSSNYVVRRGTTQDTKTHIPTPSGHGILLASK